MSAGWYAFCVFVLLAVAGFVGFVKFMAWWNIAFGGCHP